MAPYEAQYERHCRSSVCWTEVGERTSKSPDLVRDTSEKVELIRKRLLMVQSWQKSYADKRRRPLEFEVGDHVFLKVMPKRTMVRFSKRGKLSLRFIKPFEVLERVGTVAYRLVLSPNLSSVHAVFMRVHVVDWVELAVDADGTFDEGPVRIMDRREQVLLGKIMRLVKVLWQHQEVEEATWERKDTIRTNYPFLFEDEGMIFFVI